MKLVSQITQKIVMQKETPSLCSLFLSQPPFPDPPIPGLQSPIASSCFLLHMCRACRSCSCLGFVSNHQHFGNWGSVSCLHLYMDLGRTKTYYAYVCIYTYVYVYISCVYIYYVVSVFYLQTCNYMYEDMHINRHIQGLER